MDNPQVMHAHVIIFTLFPFIQTKKDEGNQFFKNKQYEEAIQKYTEAIEFDKTDVTFYSNRSACYAALNKWEQAAEDGKQCIIADKSFVKGYFRQGKTFIEILQILYRSKTY